MILGNILLTRPTPPIRAIGIALDLLHLQEPFATWPAHELISTVKGAVRREHYIMAKENNRFVGIACWGLCDGEMANGYVSGKARPTYKDCLEGENLLLFIVHSKNRDQFKILSKFVKKHHPGYRIYGRRFKSDRPGLAAKTVIIR